MPDSTTLTSLSTDQLLLTTLLVKLAVMAASATILVRFRRFRQFLIFEQRPRPDRLTFALTLGGLLFLGVAARLLPVHYDAADLTLEGAFLAGLIVGAMVGIPPLFNGECVVPFLAIGCGFSACAMLYLWQNDLLWLYSPS